QDSPHFLFTVEFGVFHSGNGLVNLNSLLDHTREDQPEQQWRDHGRYQNHNHHDRKYFLGDDAARQPHTGDNQSHLAARDHSDADAQRFLTVEPAQTRRHATAYYLA